MILIKNKDFLIRLGGDDSITKRIGNKKIKMKEKK